MVSPRPKTKALKKAKRSPLDKRTGSTKANPYNITKREYRSASAAKKLKASRARPASTTANPYRLTAEEYRDAARAQAAKAKAKKAPAKKKATAKAKPPPKKGYLQSMQRNLRR